MILSGPTLGALLQQASTSTSGVRFVHRHERSIFCAYPEIFARSCQVAGALHQIGIKPRDTVGIVLPTSPGFYHAFFGALLAGAIPTPLYPPLRLGRLNEYHARTATMLRSVGASVVLTNPSIRRLLGRTMASADCRLGVICVDDILDGPHIDPTPQQASDVALIQFSSGTTVDPKPVALTHEQLLANLQVILSALFDTFPEEDGRTHCGVSWLPLYHDMGLIGCALAAVASPGNLVLLPPEAFVAKPSLWLRAISTYRGTITAAPNFAYGLAADKIRDEELEGVQLDSLCMALNGAEPVATSTLGRFIRRFAPYGLRPESLCPVYGLAEATLAVTFSNPKTPPNTVTFNRQALQSGRAVPAKAGVTLSSVGRPLPGIQVEIRDGEVPVPTGQVGRIWVKSPSTMLGYYGRPEDAQPFAGRWLDTGDMGFWHKDELFIYGRAKDVIIVRGRNYSPAELEHLVDTVAGVRIGCSAAVAMHRENGESEDLVLFVERQHGSSVPSHQLRQDISTRIMSSAGVAPAEVHILAPGTLPRTSSGKIRRRAALEQFLAGTLAPPNKVSVPRLLFEMLRSGWHMPRRPVEKRRPT